MVLLIKVLNQRTTLREGVTKYGGNMAINTSATFK
jgi:hypothetical protein